MATQTLAIDTQHEDMIHDSQFDYYAKRLATCSSDRTIRIFDVNGNVYNLVTTLTGHDGPVWEIAWAHPKYGVLLASCSYDGQVIIHRETPAGWQKVFVHKIAEASVNAISWAPAEYGLILACASSDGKVTFLEHTDNDVWRNDEHIIVDSLGCNSVTWAPYSAVFSLSDDGKSVRRLATGSCNNHVTFWRKNTTTNTWERETVDAEPHSDWVRDVAWAPSTGLPYNLLASCSEDCTVRIWTQGQDQRWTSRQMHEFDAPVWRVSWSITGNVLAVSTGDHKVTLWKQAVDGNWIQISSMDENTES